ncbi:MAG: hypothetical protein ABL921_07215 [Pirellula sp.]
MHSNIAYICLVGVVCVFRTEVTLGQNVSVDSDQSIVISHSGLGRSIPSPDSAENLLILLRNKAIASELNLDSEQKKSVEHLLRVSGGSVSTISISRPPGATSAEIKALIASTRARNRLMFQDLLDPRQEDRLIQLAYHVEIARIGIGNALTNGYLGDNAGVEQYQKPALMTIADAIEKESLKQYKYVITEARERVWSVLDRDQATRARGCVGEVFLFIDEPGTFDQSGFSTPEVHDHSAITLILRNSSVARELGVGAQERFVITQIGKDYQTAESKIFVESKNGDNFDRMIVVDELKTKKNEAMTNALGHQKWERLEQLLFQIEISRVGMSDALTKGRFGKQLLISKGQFAKVAKTAEEYDKTMTDAIVKFRAAVKDRLFRELTGVQRQKIVQLLGRDFQFKEELIDMKKYRAGNIK